MPEPAHEALQALRERLEETRAHAQRLADDVAAGEDGPALGDGPAPGDGPRDPGDRQDDLQAIIALLQTLRGLVPPELQQQLADVTRQVLLLVRALIDWWVERLEAEPPTSGNGHSPGGPVVEDIPVS